MRDHPTGASVRFSAKAKNGVQRLRRARRHAERQEVKNDLRSGLEPAPPRRKVWRIN